MSNIHQKPNPAAHRSRLWVYSGLVVLGLLLTVLFVNLGRREDATESQAKEGETSNAVRSPSLNASPDRVGENGEGPQKTRSATRRAGELEDRVPGEFPLVERIISDTAQSDIQAAEALLEIARRSDVSLEERFEALAHGLNLDFKSFAGLAAEVNLPLELAQRYLDELLNQNQQPVLQIEGCLALLNHADKDIRSQAMEQLAFLVEKESLAESPDELKTAALAKLEELRKTSPAPATADSSEILPDLAPD